MENITRIIVTENGPLIVVGEASVRYMSIVSEGDKRFYREESEIVPPKSPWALCRCGHSSNPPFCDGSHVKAGFDGTETATRIPYAKRAKRIEGCRIDLLDDYDLCCLARFCHTDRGKIWALMEHTDDPEVRDLVVKAANECPAGRLVAVDQASGAYLEDEYEAPEIIVLNDPEMKCGGPLYVRGPVEIIGADGVPYERRSKYTLCRCGLSENKPFCDCAHAHSGWREPGWQKVAGA